MSATPRLDAELLAAHSLRISREELLTGHHALPATFEASIERRLKREPVAYIVGERAFWTIELAVAPGVLIPRADSETLIEAAVARFGGAGPERVLDLGTGSGALLLAALDQWPGATGLGIDASEDALEIARANGARIAGARAEFALGDWGAGISEQFELVLCNPPYVELAAALDPQVADWEPHAALFAGEDGLEAYCVLAPQLPRLLRAGGLACVEVGAGQAEAVAALLEAVGLRTGRRRDLGGHERCVTAQHK